jgi:hypothetical protein
MTDKYLKPMLDAGSPRVFNCSEMTLKILAKDPNATLFFRNKALNTIVLIKDAVPEGDRKAGAPMVGTKLYFPFNETNIYEGGRTIFLHDKHIRPSIASHYGEDALTKEALEEDMHILNILDGLPSLDPFLMKDVFLRHKIPMNQDYFEVSQEAWEEIETFMLQQFESLVKAAFPETESSEDKARLLIDKMWEARDLVALQPLIDAFRLPQEGALDIFSSWKGIVYYSFQYQREQVNILDLFKWLKENEGPFPSVPAPEGKEIMAAIAFIKERLRSEWQTIEKHVTNYRDSYDKMFKHKVSSSEFMTFLKNSNNIYWLLGNCLGKVNHGVYCWDAMTKRYKERKLPWPQLQGIVKLLVKVFEPEKKTTTSVAWS